MERDCRNCSLSIIDSSTLDSRLLLSCLQSSCSNPLSPSTSSPTTAADHVSASNRYTKDAEYSRGTHGLGTSRYASREDNMPMRTANYIFAATRRANAEQRDVRVRQHGEAMRQVEKEMDRAWEDLHEGWENLGTRLAGAGGLDLDGGERDIVCLNVGGVLTSIRRSILSGRVFNSVLEVAWDDGRVPRDAEGFILVDEASVYVKHLISIAMEDAGEDRARAALPTHEKPRLEYVSRALGLVPPNNNTVPSQDRAGDRLLTVVGTFASNSSSILSHEELVQFVAMMGTQSWFPGEFHGMELIYRASRDGSTAEAFRSQCGDGSPSTITLVKYSGVNSHENRADGIVGGFSSVPWTAKICGSFGPSADAFIFSLKGHEERNLCRFSPVKYDLREKLDGQAAVYHGINLGPAFGVYDLRIRFRGHGLLCELDSGNESYTVPKESPFLKLRGKVAEDIEVFRVQRTTEQASSSAPPPDSLPNGTDVTRGNDTGMSDEETEYVRVFGTPIAESVMEERGELKNARAELTRAEEKASAAIAALESVYGPDIASGKQDEVVELSVRGTRVTTLRSTLTACPDSALATRFSGKWPPADKDLDGKGRWIVDCDLAVFSKVLDVLRMKKRAGWGASGEGAAAPVPVVVREADRACFEEFVHKDFPGCEGFVMDLVEPSKAVSADERED